MVRTITMLGAAALLASCYPYRWSTALEPTGPGSYRFNALADSFDHPPDDPAAEADRIALLKDAMAKNGFCPSGYTISDRQAVRDSGLIADSAKISYFIRCTG